MPDNRSLDVDKRAIHSKEMYDIISVLPSWMVRWNILIIIFIFAALCCLVSLLQYPDTIRTSLIVESSTYSKPIVSVNGGKVVRILGVENTKVNIGEPLAFLESSVNHHQALLLLTKLRKLERLHLRGKQVNHIVFKDSDYSELGELQSDYRSFAVLLHSCKLRQTQLFNAIQDIIRVVEDWKSKYVLSASQTGTLYRMRFLYLNKVLLPNEEVFYIVPPDSLFFGEMKIMLKDIAKVKIGQAVTIKLKNRSSEDYSVINGKIEDIMPHSYQDSVFLSKVRFTSRTKSSFSRSTGLKKGMKAEAEIMLHKQTLLRRLTGSLLKVSN
jgi:multidrug efflux pump subunit AcrA (membrane-fusion protein)